MTPVLYLTNLDQLKTINKDNIVDVIVEPARISRFGKLSLDQTNQLSLEAKKLGLNVFLEWDILMVEKSFKEVTEFIGKINLDNIDAIRAQDPGAINWCIENTSKKIHLNLETGNHNLIGIESWLNLSRDRIQRVILSIEWSKKQLKELIPKLNCPVEFLGMGRILLFYTPRYLLNAGLSQRKSTLEMANSSHWMEADGQSEESPHKGFPLLENIHGTFMFLPSDHCLLDYLSELESLGISYLRVDNRFMNKDLYDQVIKHMDSPSEKSFEELKEISSTRLIRGFYNTNKSDVLFKKLKNYRIQRKDEDYLGQVLEVNKKNYLAIKLKNPSKELVNGSQLKIETPEGKTKYLDVQFLQNCRGDSLDSASGEEIVFVNHVGGVSTRAAVYFNER